MTLQLVTVSTALSLYCNIKLENKILTFSYFVELCLYFIAFVALNY